MRLACAALFWAILSVTAVARADDVIVLPPPSTASGNARLLTFVPGGKVPNTNYVALLQGLQQQLANRVDLWVAVASCSTFGRLCIPVISFPFITSALHKGMAASNVTDPAKIWIGGHSLGAVTADMYHVHNKAKAIAGGALLWGSYITEGLAGMATYPTPVLQAVAELDFGSARATKMQPFRTAAGDSRRTPVTTAFDTDHSDFCPGVHVQGDLPSDVSQDVALRRLANASAAFIAYHSGHDDAWGTVAAFSADSDVLMEPVAEAMDLERGGWCAEMQTKLAGDLSARVRVTQKYVTSGSWDAPTVNVAADGVADVVVTVRNKYEVKEWPPGSGKLKAEAAAFGAAPPPPGRSTAGTLGCKMVSRRAIAAALNVSTAAEAPATNVCSEFNNAAWAWGLANAPARTLARYHRPSPCNGCGPAAAMVFANDTTSVPFFGGWEAAELKLDFDATANTLTVQSAVATTADTQFCKLLSPARALDILMFDAFTGSVYA